MPAKLGVYIHFPWCRHLCPYCDFPVAVARKGEIPERDYLAAVLAELHERADDFQDRELVSIYIGGGTPSLWGPACLDEVISAVAARFGAARASLEITIEANPRDCTPELMSRWQGAGINRLSIGVQSMEQRTLLALGRDHRMGHGAEALAAARTSGFARISADVIFGAPGSVPRAGELCEPSVLELAGTGIGHLSVYELTIEDRTAFGRAVRARTMIPVEEDTLARMYTAIHDALTSRGYEHYEISSYARPGHRAVHNQLYWTGGEYLGLGNGAASFRRREDGGGERITNHRGVKRYLASRGRERVADHESLTRADVAADLVWLGMRTIDGVPAAALANAPALRAWLLGERLAEPRGERICPTLKGFLYANQVAAQVIAGLGESG